MLDTAIAAQTTVEIVVATTQGELTVAQREATQPDIKAQLTGIAQVIKVEMKRTVESVIKIGTLLLQAKELTSDPTCGIDGPNPDVRFSRWVSTNFVDTPLCHPNTRLNFMNVARVYGDRDPSELDGIGLSILYELAAPSTPVETRAQIEAGIQNGEQPTVKDVKPMKFGISETWFRKSVPVARRSTSTVLRTTRTRASFMPMSPNALSISVSVISCRLRPKNSVRSHQR